MATDWNKEGFFSGFTEDYSNYRWYKGEDQNPYIATPQRPWQRLTSNGKRVSSRIIYLVKPPTLTEIQPTGQRFLKLANANQTPGTTQQRIQIAKTVWIRFFHNSSSSITQPLPKPNFFWVSW